MKTKLILSVVLVSLLSAKAFSFARPPAEPESKAAMQHSMQMMDGMNTIELTGNPDVDFMTAMIPHHEGAIMMSDMMKESITDPMIRQLAESISESQKEEITFMQEWLAENPAKPEDASGLAASEKMMSETMAVMNKMNEAKMTGDPNKDFLLGMIPHHQAVIVMAEQILPSLKDEEVIGFANEVILIQNAEVETMQNWLNNVSDEKAG